MKRTPANNVLVDGRFFNEDNGVMSTPETETNEDTVSNRKQVHNFFLAGRTTTPTKTTKTIGNQCAVVGEAKQKPTTAITSFYAKAAAITNSPAEASPAESVSPWRSRLGDASVTNRALCLHTAAMRAELTHFTPAATTDEQIPSCANLPARFIGYQRGPLRQCNEPSGNGAHPWQELLHGGFC
jgi:hypothetical protein